MATLQAQTITNIINPTEGLVSYVRDIKPYHTKILEVLIEYVYKEQIVTTVIEDDNWTIALTRPEVTPHTTCGFGTVWDSAAVPDFPKAQIIQAMGDITIPVFPLIDIGFPTHLTIANDQYNYTLQVGDPVTFRTTGTLPTTTTGNISPGIVYYVLSNTGTQVTISTSPTGAPLIFSTPGTGDIVLHPQAKPYNSFLVDQPAPTSYQCIVSDVNSNQFVFMSAHNVVGVNPTLKQWTVSGQLVFAGYQDIIFTNSTTVSANTNLLNTATVYAMTVKIDTTSFLISAPGNSLQTIQDVINVINAAITGFGTATFTNNSIRITSNTIGFFSSVSIMDGPGSLSVRKLIKGMFNCGGIDEAVNNTTVIPFNHLYVRNNTGIGANTQYTIASGTYSAPNTIITVQEAISSQAQPDGVVNIQDDIAIVPNWLIGTGVKVSSTGTLPYPLSSSVVYYFVPSNDSSIFNLSTKPFPTQYSDIINVTNFGSGIVDIVRNDIFYQGAIVNVSGTFNSQNNGTYIINKVVREGSYLRVYVHEQVERFTPPLLSTDGIMQLSADTGYDAPRICTVLNASDLYTGAFIDDRITFEFSMSLSDKVQSIMHEDNAGQPGVIESTTYIANTAGGSILPMGYDMQFFDIGAIDEDINSIPNYLQ